jgi:hypothetical protein
VPQKVINVTSWRLTEPRFLEEFLCVKFGGVGVFEEIRQVSHLVVLPSPGVGVCGIRLRVGSVYSLFGGSRLRGITAIG